MPNPARASFEIELNGSKYTLRPTFESIMEFNDKAGLDIFEALRSFDKGLSVNIVVASIWAGIRGEEIFSRQGKTSFSDVGRLCQAHGFTGCISLAVDYLSRAVSSDDGVKKLEAVTENPQE
jgi:hypothetical protein